MWSVSLLLTNARRTLSGRYLSAMLSTFFSLLLPVLGFFCLQWMHSKFFVVSAVLFCVGLFFYLGCFPIGLIRFFQEFRVGAPPVSSLLSPLHGFTFVRLFLILLWKSIVIAFFSIFLLVPGIWKAYELKMVPYLLAENPYLSKSRAFTLSKKMMHQEKVRLFLLDLPFFAVFSASIAWAGAWAFLILLIILPFYCALQAEVYALLRAKALAYEWTDEGELGGFFRYPVVNQEL